MRILDVSRNELIQLPDSFGRLSSLQEFYCTKNEIRKLKETFALKLISLRHLNLNHNSISKLPHCFTQLKALEYCDLSYVSHKYIHIQLFPKTLVRLTTTYNISKNRTHYRNYHQQLDV